MNFTTNDGDKRNEEIEKFIICSEFYPNLFPSLERTNIQNHILNYIDEVKVDNSKTKKDITEYGSAIRKQNEKFTIKYVSLNNDNQDKFIINHELGHVLLTPTHDNKERYNGMAPSQGACKYDRTINDFYGMAISEGTINFLSKLAILNVENTSRMKKYLDDCNYRPIEDHYKLSEELASLLILASTPITSIDPSEYLTNLIKTKGINNENGSIYLNSCFNNDFSFEKEFDSYLGMGSCKKMYEDIDVIQNKISKDEEYEPNDLKNILSKINTYYNNKLQEYLLKGNLNDNSYNILQQLFFNRIDRVIESRSIKEGDKTI